MTEMRKYLPLPEQEEEEVLFWLQEEIVVDPQTGKRGYWRTVRRGGKWVHIFIAAEGSPKPPDVIVMVGPAGEIRLRLNPAAGTFGQIKDKIKALGGWWDSLTKTWWFPGQEPTTVLRKIGAELAQTGDVEVGWTPQAMGQWASYLVGETLGKEVPQRVLEAISSGELWLQKIPEENWDGFVRFLYERGAFGRGGYADFALRFLGDMQQRYGRRLANLTSRQQEVWRNINRGVAKWLRDNPTQAEEALRFFPATKEEESPTPIEEPQKETGPPTAKTIEQVAAGGEYDFEAILEGNRVTALALMQAIQDGRLPPVTQLPFLRQDELIEGQMPLHQQAGIWWLLAKRRGFLAYEAGLGKTLCFLGASLLRQFGIASSEGVKSTSLIVVPASRVLGTKAEIERFFQIPAEEIFVIPPGTPAQERAAMLNRIRPSNPPRFIIVSYDIMRIEAERLKQVLKPLRVASIIADEAHYVKDWKAQRTRAFFDIVEEKRHGAAVWLVSATPFSNASPSEVFNLLYGMGAWPNMRRNDAWLQFAHRYCEQRRSALAKWWEWLEGAPRRIYQNFGSVILHLPKDDESVKRFFPQAIRDYAYLDWDAVHGPFATFYATLEDLYSTIKEAARTTGERTLGGKALGLINLLLWAVSAPETIKQEDLERAFSHEAEHWTPEEVRQKIIEVGEEKVASALAAAEFLRHLRPRAVEAYRRFKDAWEGAGRPVNPKLQWTVDTILSELGTTSSTRSKRGVLVFSFLLEPLAALREALRSHGIASAVLTGETPIQERAQIEADFNEGRVPVVLASAAGQEGINLQRHASMVVHYQVPHNPREMDQREGRVWRMDNPNKGVVLSMPIMADTYEEVFAKNLAQKGANFAALVGVEEAAEGGFIERFRVPLEHRRSPSLFSPEERQAVLAKLKRALEEAKKKPGAGPKGKSKGKEGEEKEPPPKRRGGRKKR